MLRGTTGYMVPGPHNFWAAAPVDQPAPTEFGTKAVIVIYCTNFHKPKLCTKFEVAT